MATHNAIVSTEGSETVVRISGKLNLPYGQVNAQEIERTGQVILSPMQEAGLQNSWATFLDDLSSRPHDEEFIKERPMNRPPIEKKLFSED